MVSAQHYGYHEILEMQPYDRDIFINMIMADIENNKPKGNEIGGPIEGNWDPI